MSLEQSHGEQSRTGPESKSFRNPCRIKKVDMNKTGSVFEKLQGGTESEYQ